VLDALAICDPFNMYFQYIETLGAQESQKEKKRQTTVFTFAKPLSDSWRMPMSFHQSSKALMSSSVGNDLRCCTFIHLEKYRSSV